ncbi:MAG: hypothetical protein ACLRM8_00710 [Alistipes sp.]
MGQRRRSDEQGLRGEPRRRHRPHEGLSFSATFIYSMNRNKVVSLGDAISSGLSQDYLTGLYYEVTGEPISMFNQNASIYAVGHPMNVFYGYRVDGIIQEGQDPVHRPRRTERPPRRAEIRRPDGRLRHHAGGPVHHR